ncbi:MAG: hypothetical protein JRI36_02100 [Deltaproteobacteria bacterium]|nr:hypothetical protein [Deltaproteobacteria bacterium]
MGEKKTLEFSDFKDVTDCIYSAVDKIETLYKSLALSDAQKSELARLGGLLQGVSHDIGHFFMDLESLSEDIRAEVHDYYGH